VTREPRGGAERDGGGPAAYQPKLTTGAKFDVEVIATIYAKPDTWQDGFERLDQSSSQSE